MVIRSRQHLAAVVAHENALILVLLRFADELRDDKGLDLPSTNLKTLGITPKELQMAERLVDGMVTSFEPEKYEDDYRRDLKKLIQRKVKAGEVNTLPTETKRKAKPAPAASDNERPTFSNCKVSAEEHSATVMIDRSSPRPITTNAMPSARTPNSDTFSNRLAMFCQPRKPLNAMEKMTKRTAVSARTIVSWLKSPVCRRNSLPGDDAAAP